MIHGIFHAGSGLGNQLFRYVATRTTAERLDVPFSMIGDFKGKDFMELDLGEPNTLSYTIGAGGELFPQCQLTRFSEKKVVENGVDIRGYDPEFYFIEDNTVIDGEFQDERYFSLEKVREWFKTKPIWVQDDMCVIGFRGGEFQYIPELYLTRDYYEDAIKAVRAVNPEVKFICVTDDPQAAAKMLPSEVKITHELSTDWRMVRSAKYLIISNSSFYIFPALLNNHADLKIAPRYWARRNTQTWALPSNYYSAFTYI